MLAMAATAVSAKHQPPAIGQVASINTPHTEKAVVESAPPEPQELQVVEDSFDVEVIDLDEPAIYIVQLEDPAVPSYRGGVAGLEATSPRVTGEEQLDVRSPESLAYSRHLLSKQDRLIADMEAALSREVDVKFQYHLSINGLAVELTPDEAAQVAELDGVKSVVREWVEHLQTDVGPAWVGAEGIWDGSATGGFATKGEGIIVGVVDTGINHDHPSFADVGDDGYDHTNPWGAGNYTGYCDPANANYTTTVTCNDKLIGLWSFDEDLPEDYRGHGTHVASTAAGNVLSATFHAPTTAITRTISGVAPHANIIAYNIEGDPGGGTAPYSSILAATQQAISDTVDVINYSFGGDPGDPWVTAEHWLNVRDAGIFVATSAGNAGPGPGTVGSPGNAPWMLTVANSTHNRRITNSLINMTPDGPADIEGKGFTAGYGPAEIIYAGHVANPNDPGGDPAQCLEPFPAGTFDGEIVVCDRGEIARVQKGLNVLAGGAGGFVLANTALEGESIVGDTHFLPGVHIGETDALTLRAWLTDTAVQTATISGYQVEVADAYGDIMNTSSSRGPNFTEDILKPDVTAPGTDVLAAVQTDHDNPSPYPEFDFYSGTSMASPHVAGVAALLRALHPTWTPAQIQSAIMTTAINRDGILKEDGETPTDPFDRGSGRAYASAAANAGLLLDETTQAFIDANPSAEGDPKNLNLASFADGECMRECGWTREVGNALPYTVTWTANVLPTSEMTLTVTPATFELPPGASQEIMVEADVAGLPTNGTYAFGGINFVPTTPFTTPVDAFFPVAVKPSSGVLPDLVTINASRNAGSKLVEDLKALEITDLTINRYGLVANEVEFSVSQVPHPGFPEIFFQTGVHTETITVPEGSPRLVAEVLETTSPDLDMMVVYDSDGDGVAEQSDIDDNACQSAIGGPYEYCSIPNPPAGTWFVLVANYEESAMAPDAVTLAAVVVPEFDAGNLMVVGPDSVPAATPFDLRVVWDEPALEPGDHYYGAFGISSSEITENDIGVVPVNLVRMEDDVSKTAAPDPLDLAEERIVTYTISIQNPRPVSVTYTITDVLPDDVTFGGFTIQGGATYADGVVSWSGTLDAMLPGVEVVEAPSPAGYFPMASIGIPEAPCSELCDETILGFSGLSPFSYLGDSYTDLAMVTNGYVIPGGGDLDDVTYINQLFPDPDRPNNVAAPLWTDLDLAPSAFGGDGAGTWYAAQLTAGAGTGWVVLEWVGAQEWNSPGITHTFQIWLDQYADDVSMVYGAVDSEFDVGTVGGENATGMLGDNYYYDGDGTAPTPMTELKIRKTGGTPPSHTIQFTATVGLTDMVTNTVLSSVDIPYSEVEEHLNVLHVMPNNLYLPVIMKGSG
jgi:subtilisin family serine protease